MNAKTLRRLAEAWRATPDRRARQAGMPATPQRQRANRVLVGQQKQQLQNSNKTIELLAKRYYKAT